MKKLVVLVLSVVMLVSLTAAAMAATTTIGGEINGFYYDQENGNDQGRYEVRVKGNTVINNMMNGYFELRNRSYQNAPSTYLQKAYVDLKQDYGTYRFGYFDMGNAGSVDILSSEVNELKSDYGVQLTMPSDMVTVKGYVGENGAGQTQYGAGVVVEPVDVLSVEGYYFDSSDDANTGFALATSYTGIEDVDLYLHYAKDDADNKDTIIGGSYDNKTLYARAEYNLEDVDDFNGYGATVGYRFNNNAYVQYQHVEETENAAKNEVKVGFKF